MKIFDSLSYNSENEIIFGRSKKPIKTGFDLAIGNGLVFPEINYTLGSIQINKDNFSEILEQYKMIVSNVLSRAVKLQTPGLVLEFEHLPKMTDIIEIGVKITEQTKKLMGNFYEKYGLKSALRVTICDTRDKDRPPLMQSGESVNNIFKAFNENSIAGADLLSIESTGGKEVSDQAIMEADIVGILFSLGILAPVDMHFLWREITKISKRNNVIAAGDTACGIANTAMVLADKKYIPEVFAAVVRAMSSVRSLIAYEEGAIGPSKDCAYEGPIIKIITGYPISMEGKSSACAHFSHLGNIAAAVCDLWSNESVQNVRLLSGYAPEVFFEILAYDCRLMNKALEEGKEKILQELMVGSDKFRNVQAFIISPNSSFKIAKEIIRDKVDFNRTYQAGITACNLIREAVEDRQLVLSEREIKWLNIIEEQLNQYSNIDDVMSYSIPKYKNFMNLSEYGL
jgi:methanol--5-hydroxybenzimidazolylcobamide Co-methyltransferase